MPLGCRRFSHLERWGRGGLRLSHLGFPYPSSTYPLTFLLPIGPCSLGAQGECSALRQAAAFLGPKWQHANPIDLGSSAACIIHRGMVLSTRDLISKAAGYQSESARHCSALSIPELTSLAPQQRW